MSIQIKMSIKCPRQEVLPKSRTSMYMHTHTHLDPVLKKLSTSVIKSRY